MEGAAANPKTGQVAWHFLRVSGAFAIFVSPAENTALQSGDRILFAGQRGVAALQRRFLLEPSPLAFVRTGVEPPRSWLFRSLHMAAKRRRLRQERERRAAARR